MNELEIYRKALEKIAALRNITQTRGLFEHMSTPGHLLIDGWGEIHPYMKRGFEYAANIALQALKTAQENE